MDFEANDDQRAILDAVQALLAKHAGAARAIALARDGAYDFALEAALADAGFLDLARGPGTGLLEAVLLVEAVTRAGGTVAIGAAALVAPGVSDVPLDGPIALATASGDGPVRYAAHARTLLVLDGEDAHAVALAPGAILPVRSSFGHPMGGVPAATRKGGTRIGGGARLQDLWRLALAAEAAGAMRAALDVTLAYVKRRRQFGRAIGSFQAVQHRLAECHVQIEGARWLVLEAAHRAADAESAAIAAAHALDAAGRVFAETHQLSGAMGYTREHDLHVFSMRLAGLRLELGGVGAHARGAAEARWG
jgi:alkylation response protein AidB-like acyl-CoA dehydrogenase